MCVIGCSVSGVWLLWGEVVVESSSGSLLCVVKRVGGESPGGARVLVTSD